MVWKKILLFSIILISLISGVNALEISDNNNRAYWSFDNTLTDLTGISGSVTNFGATYTASGLINGSYNFDGLNDYMNQPTTLSSSTGWNIAGWINADAYAGGEMRVIGNGNTGVRARFGITNVGLVQCVIGDGGVTTTKTLSTTTWYFFSMGWNVTSGKGYCQINDGTYFNTTRAFTSDQTFKIGQYGTNIRYWDGRIDELSIWNTSLSSDEIDILYNSGVGCQYGFQSCLILPTTPTINHNISAYYKNSNISIGLNTSSNVNMSYYLDSLNSTINYYEINKSIFLQDFSISAKDNTPTGLKFNNDGSQMYFSGLINDKIHQYNLGINYDISTSIFSNSLDVSGVTTSPGAFTLNDDGSKLFVPDSASLGDKSISQYDLSTPFLLSSAIFNNDVIWSFKVVALEFNNNGSKVFMDSGNNIYTYDLTVNYNLSTAVLDSINAITINSDFEFNNDGSSIYIISNSFVKQFNLGINYDLSTMITTNLLNVIPQDSISTALTFDNNGSKLFTIGSSNDKIYEYNLLAQRPQTSICNNCNLITLNLNTLGDGQYNIIFNALDSAGQTNSSANFTIDTILPVITNNINSTITDYLFNADFSCTDINLVSCNISINGFNKVNNSIFTLNNNGNLSYNLTAIDLAGNQLIENNVLFVNPFQLFKFNDTTLDLLVSSFTFGGISSIGNQVKIPTYNSVLSLGSNVLEFFKFGYNIQNFTININTTSDINQTYDITPTTLVIKVFDSTSITTQLTFNITIINATSNQVFTNQVNFSKRFNETLGGAISLVIESDGYSTGYFFNTLNQDTTLNINSYLTPINESSTIRFFVADSAQASVGLVGVLIELQKLINGSYVTIQQGMTGDSGESFIQTDASESYLFIFSKSGFVSATAQSIPNILDYSVTLSLVSQVFTYIDDISFSFTPIETILDYNQSINFTGFISGPGFSFTQFNIYNSTNDLIYRQNSTNPTGTSFIKQISISNTTTEITTEIVYIVDGITKTTSKTYTIKAITGFIKTAQDYSEDETFTAKFIRFLVIMILVVSSLAITRTESIQEISLFVVPVYVFLSYINFIPWTQAAALSMLAIIFFIGGKR